MFFPSSEDYPHRPPGSSGPWVSALTQGLALELFVMLARETGDERYTTDAAQTFASYLVPIEDGGFAKTTADGAVVFEQYPAGGPATVMSGGLIATLALGDYASATGDIAARTLWSSAVTWWTRNIGRYDVSSALYTLPLSAYSLDGDAAVYRVDNDFLDDNARLLKLLAEASNSDILRGYAARWRGDERYVPFAALGHLPDPLLVNETPSPVLSVRQSPSEETLHVEYPTVFHRGGENVMFYSAFGDDRRWRIKEAVSANSIAWIRYGNLFDETKLPFAGNYAFPFVTQQSEGGPYDLYFSVQASRDRSYDQLWRSQSADGLHWSPPALFLEDNLILDPVVIKRDGRLIVLYTSKEDHGPAIKMAWAFDSGGARLNAPKSIYVPNANSVSVEVGLYTLGVIPIGTTNVIVAEEGLQSRVDWVALCFADNQSLKAVVPEAIASFPQLEEQWDALKYGPFFTAAADGTVKAYFNGIRGLGVESGGQIGYAEVNLQHLREEVAAASCH